MRIVPSMASCLFAICAVAIVLHAGCDQLADQSHVSNQRSPNAGSQDQSLIAAEALNSASNDESSQFGSGEMMREANNSKLPCGSPYQETFVGTTNVVQTWGDPVRSFDIDVKTKMAIGGNASKSAINVQSELTVNSSKGLPARNPDHNWYRLVHYADRIERVAVAGQEFNFGAMRRTDNQSQFDTEGYRVSSASSRGGAYGWDGIRTYSFFPRNKIASELANVSGWKDIRCSVLGVAELIYERSGMWMKLTYDPPLPKFVVPNASKEIYEKELAEPRIFKTKASRQTFMPLDILNKKFPIDTNALAVKYGPVISVVDLEVKVELVSVKNEMIQLRISSVFRDENGVELVEPSARAAQEAAKQRYGVLPTMDFFVNANSQRTDRIELVAPYNRNGWNYFYAPKTILRPE